VFDQPSIDGRGWQHAGLGQLQAIRHGRRCYGSQLEPLLRHRSPDAARSLRPETEIETAQATSGDDYAQEQRHEARVRHHVIAGDVRESSHGIVEIIACIIERLARDRHRLRDAAVCRHRHREAPCFCATRLWANPLQRGAQHTRKSTTKPTTTLIVSPHSAPSKVETRHLAITPGGDTEIQIPPGHRIGLVPNMAQSQGLVSGGSQAEGCGRRIFFRAIG